MTILEIQTALKAAGFDPGPLDGKTGRGTKAAIKAFQKARGLAVDGVVGPGTAAALAPPNASPSVPAPGQSTIPGLTILDVKRLSSKANLLWATALVAGWPEIVRVAGLKTPLRARHFLAQTAHESTGFTRFQEDLQNYSAARLMQVWPSKFPTLAAAKPYAHNAPALAEKVYGGRVKDLGNTEPGDGWKFHGMGPIQATGRRWATRIAAELGLDLVAHPELMLEPATGWRSAAAIWALDGCNAFADRNDVTGETKRVNGGLNGLAERKAFLALAETLPLKPVPVAA